MRRRLEITIFIPVFFFLGIHLGKSGGDLKQWARATVSSLPIDLDYPSCDSPNPTALWVGGQYIYITAGKFALCNLCIHLPYAPFTQVGNMGVGRII